MNVVKKLAVSVLDDEYGISVQSWEYLRDVLLAHCSQEETKYIINGVRATEDRVYLSSNYEGEE